ncbi:putative McbC-like oxidoreductase [Arcobacter venerupis]|uniref:McbC-like oxidoreductase n=1 Tax=Arcobacter venerupis TaxID=1054033 RepID=A0AAE7E5E2_9BACT|nr:SagB family peptide dehydrogenase [Arcobacter venerupis]QKF67706.1 putative McbC-like oxidoreductase [Arcobacter venerupis]RWS49138.1 dehydrogenase [Arcobacter venerupis]
MLIPLNNYHQNTKHSYNSIRVNPNRVNWNNPPNKFKFYPKEYTRIPLLSQNDNYNFLYLISGISAKKTYPGVEYYLRVNPSAGALYPNELYFQVRNVDGFEDGIYHLEVASSSAVLLQKLENNEGIEELLELSYSIDGFIFFVSSLYFRSSWKYKNRAFRYCLLDAGHLIGTIEASSYLFNKEFEVIYDFSKEKLNEFFSFDEKEFFTSIVIAGEKQNNKKVSFSMLLPTLDGASYIEENISFFEKNKLVEMAYQDSLEITDKKAQEKSAIFNFQKQKLQDTIFKRRSIREFTKQSISKLQFESIMNVVNQAIKSDCDEQVDIYYTINRVEGYILGLYKNGELLRTGDFNSKAGYLCLEQDLGTSSAVTFFLTSKGKNYQELYQKAGVIGHRLYIASNYLDIGCSGIGAYYDDEVCEFIEENTMVLYALAIGN